MVATYQGYASTSKIGLRLRRSASKRADDVIAGLTNGLDEVYAHWSQQITEYLNGFDRIRENNQDPKKWGGRIT